MPSIHSRAEDVGSVVPPLCKGNLTRRQKNWEKLVIERIHAIDMEIQLPAELFSSEKWKKSERSDSKFLGKCKKSIIIHSIITSFF